MNIFANVTSGALGRRAISRWVVNGWMWQYAEPALCRYGMYSGPGVGMVVGVVVVVVVVVYEAYYIYSSISTPLFQVSGKFVQFRPL